jgi:DNA-binding response OmpR family regulator
MRPYVLIIDDDADECRLLSDYLKRKHFQVDIASSINEGIDIMRLTLPDHVLLDNHLAEGPGWKYAGLIKGLFPQLKLTLISGDHTENRDARDSFRKLYKPLDMDELEALLGN